MGERLPLSLMLVLTFVTGVLDAAGYLGLGRTFTGNMTGNLVILGMGVAGGEGLPVLGPLVALTGFTGGAALAGAVLRGSDPSWSRRVTVLLSAGAVVLLCCAAGMSWLPLAAEEILRVGLAGVIAAQMGSQALVARHLAVKDITTVVVTSTLTSLAGESFYRPGARVWNRRVAAILVLLLGAVVGAGLLRVHAGLPGVVTAALTAAVAVGGARSWPVKNSCALVGTSPQRWSGQKAP